MEDSLHAIGTCDGTGADINVCLGFVPSYVKVWNMDDDTNVQYWEWHSQMQYVTAMAEGLKSDKDVFTAITADGITEYGGGEQLIYDGVTNNRWEYDHDGDGVLDADAEEVFVNGHYLKVASGDAAYQSIGDSQIGASTPRNGEKIKSTAGFTIGALANWNVNGEQLAWIAYR
ncbi:hypothetical protein LCGC14_0384480 [marine sediment metagenome]|uniref:Uncharacterized protein n=1 Tax=marine sediment metagenome TaxID=412755 RepID=A0A0F9T7A0_9ZZZZ